MTRHGICLAKSGSDKTVRTWCGGINPPAHKVTTDYQRASCPVCRRKGKP